MDIEKKSMLNLSLYKDKFMFLKIYLDKVPLDIKNKYIIDINNRQEEIIKYLKKYYIKNNELSNEELSNEEYIDAGFDLYVPSNSDVEGYKTTKINMHVKTAMFYNNIPCGFYLYPRSSTGSKTPLRLANSVGVIDSGYRGNCIAVFDNNNEEKYSIKKGDRLVQICSGNLFYPIFPILVENEKELGKTLRGEGGFGSTGR